MFFSLGGHVNIITSYYKLSLPMSRLSTEREDVRGDPTHHKGISAIGHSISTLCVHYYSISMSPCLVYGSC